VQCGPFRSECSQYDSKKRERVVAGSEKRFLRHDIGQEFIILISSKDIVHFVSMVKLYGKHAELIVVGPSELCNWSLELL